MSSAQFWPESWSFFLATVLPKKSVAGLSLALVISESTYDAFIQDNVNLDPKTLVGVITDFSIPIF